MSADLVFRGGRIFTGRGPGRTGDASDAGDAGEPPEAVAVRAGRIEAVGPWHAVRDLVGPRSRVFDLTGRMLLPGFQDAHAHPPAAGLIDVQCNLYACVTEADCAEVLARWAAEHPDDSWIVGGGWSWESFAPPGPDRYALDRVVGERLVFLESADGHAAWVSSAALRLAGIADDTRDPPGGRIERDEHGEATGLLQEDAAELVETLLPAIDAATWREAILRAQATLHRLGITAWQDAAVSAATHASYRALDTSGHLTARVTGALSWNMRQGADQLADLEEMREDSGPVARYRATAVKLFQDGIIENFTATLDASYLDGSGRPTGNRGIAVFDPGHLAATVVAIDAAGFDVHVHVIGDRAVRESLDAFGAARSANGRRDARHQLAHLQLVAPADCARFVDLGIIANIQALWACPHSSIDDLALPFLDADRAGWLYPFGSLWRAGAALAMGSDWAVSSADPLSQIEVAVTRIDPDRRSGPPLLPGERLPADVALEAFTRGSARANRLDASTGTIEAGKAADLVVLDRDVLAADCRFIGDARVVLTVVDGRPVHAASGFGW